MQDEIVKVTAALDSPPSVKAAGKVAARAGMSALVPSSPVPDGDPSITDQMWLDAAEAHLRGEVILGKD